MLERRNFETSSSHDTSAMSECVVELFIPFKGIKPPRSIFRASDRTSRQGGRTSELSLSKATGKRNGSTVERRALVCFYSYTGNTRLVAAQLRDCLRTRYEVDLVEIKPRREQSYPLWLAYSFIPNSRVEISDINSDVSSYDLVCLATPKWTFSCPPFNEYLRIMTNCQGKRIGLIVTYGGFRERDFIRRTVNMIKQKKPSSILVLAIRRRDISCRSYVTQVEDFSARLQ